MTNDLFSQFAPILRRMSKADLLAEIVQPRELLIANFAVHVDLLRGRADNQAGGPSWRGDA